MNKEKILSIAEAIFYSKRYSDIKLDIIANELNIQKPSLYHYFKNKKDLFLQMFDYSQKKYFQAFYIELRKNDIKNFIIRYLEYPLKEKNVFGISFQKNYCIDKMIRKKIFLGKQKITSQIKEYFSQYNFDEVKIYLFVNLLEKLAQNNCMDEFCLQFNAEKLANGILEMIKIHKNI